MQTFIKLPFVSKIFLLSILSGHFTQVLLYSPKNYDKTIQLYPFSPLAVLLVMNLFCEYVYVL